MRKKISYIIIIFIIGFIFNNKVLANTSCNYYGQNVNGVFYVSFSIKDNGDLDGKATLSGYVDSTDEKYIDSEKQGVENWTKEKMTDFIGKNWYETHKNNDDKGCPPYAIFVDRVGQFDLYVSDEENLPTYENYGMVKQGYQIVRLFNGDLKGKKYTINFYANKEGVEGSMESVTGTYGIATVLPKNQFSFYGYTPVGWMVMNDGKWLCNTEQGTQYRTYCELEDRELKGDGVLFMEEFTEPHFDLYMKWVESSSISSLAINQYNLGKDVCTSKGYIWNETKYGNYCNTDNLTYVGCGDAFDIPSQVPQLISFGVNLLKIATPIILIFVSIITLVKAIASSKEDDIKKAQSSLVKKMIAAVLVFFIVSIVQYVILWVADSSDTDSISSCLSCFLNNDCDKNLYYKTKGGLGYQCTYIDNGNSFDCK